MSAKEKGGFDLGDIGVVTRSILQKKVEEKKEEPPKAEAKPRHVETIEEPAPAKTEAPQTAAPVKERIKKVVQEDYKSKSDLVKTSYMITRSQMGALKRIAMHTGKDFAEVLRQIIDYGIEKIEKKNPDLLKEMEVKEIF